MKLISPDSPVKLENVTATWKRGRTASFFFLLFRFEVAFQTICTVGIQYATVEISTTNVTFVSCANMPPTWLPVPRDSFVPFTMYVSSLPLLLRVCFRLRESFHFLFTRARSVNELRLKEVASKKGVERFFPFLGFLCYSTIQTVEQR